MCKSLDKIAQVNSWGYIQKTVTQVTPEQRHLHTHAYCSTIHNSQDGNSQDAPPLMNGLRKCGIYTQWNFMQP
jgi:hypothetical protein